MVMELCTWPSLLLQVFFQLERQVNIIFYLTKAPTLHHAREIVGLKPPWCVLSPINFFGFLDLKTNFISFNW